MVTKVKKFTPDDAIRLTSLGPQFYRSKPWRLVRRRALLIYGRKCHCCSSVGSKKHPVHVDHIHPVSLYPERALDITNLQVLCGQCNGKKSNKIIEDYRPEIHRTYAEQYSQNIRSIKSIILERETEITLDESEIQKRSEQRKQDKAKNPGRVQSKKQRIKAQTMQMHQQVKFLEEVRKAHAKGNLTQFIASYQSIHGVETTKALAIRCNIKHWLAG